ncbi:hypothetical protein HK100_008668, partial [Physocladia obscura]
MERYKAKRQDIQTLQQNLKSLERTYNSVASDESSRLQAVNVIDTKLSSLEKEIKDQEEKRDRAYKSAIRASKILKSSQKEFGAFEELDFRIRECKDLGNLVQTEISRIMDQHPEITMKVMDLYTQPPSRPLSRVPSRTDSNEGSDTSSSGGRNRLFKSGRLTSTTHSRASSRTSALGASFGGVAPRSQTQHSRQSTDRGGGNFASER